MSNINIANKRVAKSDVLYHIALSEEMINSATIAILPGDPKDRNI